MLCYASHTVTHEYAYSLTRSTWRLLQPLPQREAVASEAWPSCRRCRRDVDGTSMSVITLILSCIAYHTSPHILTEIIKHSPCNAEESLCRGRSGGHAQVLACHHTQMWVLELVVSPPDQAVRQSMATGTFAPLTLQQHRHCPLLLRQPELLARLQEH